MSTQNDMEWSASSTPWWAHVAVVGWMVIDFTAGLLRVARRMLPTRRMLLASVVRIGIGASLLMMAGTIVAPVASPIVEFAGKAMLFLAAYGLIGHAEGVFQSAVARLFGIDDDA